VRLLLVSLSFFVARDAPAHNKMRKESELILKKKLKEMY